MAGLPLRAPGRGGGRGDRSRHPAGDLDLFLHGDRCLARRRGSPSRRVVGCLVVPSAPAQTARVGVDALPFGLGGLAALASSLGPCANPSCATTKSSSSSLETLCELSTRVVADNLSMISRGALLRDICPVEVVQRVYAYLVSTHRLTLDNVAAFQDSIQHVVLPRYRYALTGEETPGMCRPVTDQFVQRLSRFAGLITLDLSGCVDVSDISLAYVCDAAQLRVLLLDDTRVSDTGLAALVDIRGESSRAPLKLRRAAARRFVNASVSRDVSETAAASLAALSRPALAAACEPLPDEADGDAEDGESSPPASPIAGPSSKAPPLQQTPLRPSSPSLRHSHCTTTGTTSTSSTAPSTAAASPRLSTATGRSTATAAAADLLPSWPTGLNVLSLRRTGVSDLGLCHVRSFKHLRVLHLEGTHVSDSGVSQLRQLHELMDLTLSCTKITGAGLAALAPLTALQRLSLHTTGVADDGLPHLSALRELRSLSLAFTDVTASGIEHLTVMQHLLELDVSRTRVGDDLVPLLVHFPHLAWLGIFDAAATEATIADLATERTDLILAYDGTMQQHLAALARYCMPETRQPALVEAVLGQLRQWAYNPEKKVEMVQQGGVPCLLDVMRHSADEEVLLVKALATMWSLAVNAQNRIVIAQHGGIPHLLQLMRTHKAVARVAQNVSGVLWNMSVTAANQKAIVDDRGIEAVLAVMAMHMPSAVIMVNCTAVLWNLSLNGHQSRLAWAGGVVHVLQAVRSHSNNRELCLNCAAILWNLAVVPENQALIGQHDGIALLLELLTTFPDDEEMLVKACGAMMLLALHDRNRVDLVRLKGVATLLDVLEAQLEQERIVLQVMGVLWNLSVDSDSQVVIAQARGIERVLDAARAHASNERLIIRSTGVLWNLSIRSDNQPAILAAGGLVVLQQLLADHGDSRDLVQNVTSVWWNLAVHPDNKVSMGAVIDPVLQMLDMYGAQRDLCVNLLAVLWNLAVTADNRRRIGADGAVAALQALRRYPDDIELLVKAIGVLKTLANDEQLNSVIAHNDGAGIILAAAHQHVRDDALVKAAIGALPCLGVLSPITAQHIVSTLGRWTDEAAQRLHPCPSCDWGPGRAHDAPPACNCTASLSLDVCVGAVKALAVLAFEPSIAAIIADAPAVMSQLRRWVRRAPSPLQVHAADALGRLATHEALRALLPLALSDDLRAAVASPPHTDAELALCARWALARVAGVPSLEAQAVVATRHVKVVVPPADAQGMPGADAGAQCVLPTHLRNDSPYFESVRLTRGISGGKWYWEHQLDTCGLMQLGIARASCPFDPEHGEGVGDHVDSWAYDGHRQRKWNGDDADYGPAWCRGDVISVLFDADAGRLEFWRNGVSIGLAFDAISVNAAAPVYPAVSIGTCEQLQCHMTAASLVHAPPPGYASLQQLYPHP